MARLDKDTMEEVESYLVRCLRERDGNVTKELLASQLVLNTTAGAVEKYIRARFAELRLRGG
jgi:hypothetical protein